MGDRHNMAAVHPDEQAGIELGFGFRNRPRAHPLPSAVMDPGIMGVGADAPDIGGGMDAATGTGSGDDGGVVPAASATGPVVTAAVATGCRRGSGTSDSRNPAAMTKHSSATTTERICCDAASPPPW